MEQKKLNRRKFLQATAATTAGVILASCAPAATPQATNAEGAAPTMAPAEQEARTMRMWHWDSFLLEGYKQVTAEIHRGKSEIDCVHRVDLIW